MFMLSQAINNVQIVFSMNSALVLLIVISTNNTNMKIHMYFIG